MSVTEKTRAFAPHVEALIKKIDLPNHALLRAYGGACYFDQYAPVEWRLRMMYILSGRVHSRVNFTYDKDYPFALAFGGVDLTGGFVADEQRWFCAAEKCGFTNPRENRDVYLLGCREQEHRDGDTVISSQVDCDFLNEAWQKVLSQFLNLKDTRSRPPAELENAVKNNVHLQMLQMSQQTLLYRLLGR